MVQVNIQVNYLENTEMSITIKADFAAAPAMAQSGIGSHCNESAHMGQYQNIKHEK